MVKGFKSKRSFQSPKKIKIQQTPNLTGNPVVLYIQSKDFVKINWSTVYLQHSGGFPVCYVIDRTPVSYRRGTDSQ